MAQMMDADDRVPAGARRSRLLESLRRDGFMNVSRAAAALGVSSMTIRRDLTALAEAGEIERTHGGAMQLAAKPAPAPENPDEPEFEKRRRTNGDTKHRIAVAAAQLIGNREAVGLDVGTTALALARQICGRRDLRVITNNVRAATLLAHAQMSVYLLGGYVRTPELSVVGPMAETQAQQFFLARLFLAVSGLTADGLYDYSPEDSRMKEALLDRAEQVVLICDSSKFGQRSLVRVCGLERIAVLVTDAPPERELQEALRAAGVIVNVAPPVAAERSGRAEEN